MRINSMNREVVGKKSYLGYYIIAGMSGIVVGFTILVIIQGVKFAVSMIIKYWWWAILGVFGFLILKKMFRGKKRIEPD